eukprot:GFYU01041340.1.p1 GENE.GFYU01041340.1~~GFYU01041340.1.p1  ORF type:complete len:327 (-),score=51.57 GFYU01041340.1:183-1163(-)
MQHHQQSAESIPLSPMSGQNTHPVDVHYVTTPQRPLNDSAAPSGPNALTRQNSLRERTQVRENVRQTAEQGLQKKIFIYSTLYTVTEVIIIWVLLGRSWENACDADVQTWLLVTSLFHFFGYVLTAVRYKHGAESMNAACATGFLRPLNTGWVIWLIIGSVWMFSSETCKDSAEDLYYLAMIIIVFSYVLLGISIASLLLSIFCLPFYIESLTAILEQVGTETQGASRELIASLRTEKYRPGIVPQEDAQCALCFEDYQVDEELRFCPCNHHFHAPCVDKWLAINKTCPVCRTPIDGAPQEAAGPSSMSRTTEEAPAAQDPVAQIV